MSRTPVEYDMGSEIRHAWIQATVSPYSDTMRVTFGQLYNVLWLWVSWLRICLCCTEMLVQFLGQDLHLEKG